MANRMVTVAVAAFLVAGCGSGSGSDTRPDSVPAQGAESSRSGAARADVPDPCRFVPREMLETAVGWELREGQPKADSAGSSCVFDAQGPMSATPKDPNLTIPESDGFKRLTITTFPSTPEKFAEGQRRYTAEKIIGLGDDAYFDGSNLIYVRVADQAVSVRIHTDAPSPAHRSAMLVLARIVMARLSAQLPQS